MLFGPFAKYCVARNKIGLHITLAIKLEYFRLASHNEWERFWRNSPNATFFHSPEWYALWDIYTHGLMKPYPILICFSDQKKLIIPFARKITRFRRKQFYSSPAGTFGGWLSSDQMELEHAFLIIKALQKRLKNIVVRANPYDQKMVEAFAGSGIEDETDTLNLENGFDSLLDVWKKGKKSIIRKVKKAHKLGVTVREANNSNDWKAYFHCYKDSLTRWGTNATSSYRWEFFDIIRKRKSQNVRLWLAEYEGRIISGALCFYSTQHAVYWHGATLSEYFNLRATNLLMFEAIKDASNRNLSWFDFNPSGGHEGVRRFKQSFKTTRLQCPVITYHSRLGQILRSVKQLKAQVTG